MTDTHTHLYLPEFEDGGAAAVRAALQAGVSSLIFPNVDHTTVLPMIELHRLFPLNTSIALGLHPTEVDPSWRDRIDEIDALAAGEEIVAVGEIGMDLYWEKKYESLQMQALEFQLKRAALLRLPAIIHCREALPQTLEVIAGLGNEQPALIFHSFTLGPDEVGAIRKVCDPMFGINGVVTYKNAQPLRDALPEIGLDRLLTETDSPYLSPVPHRGHRNESAFIPLIADKIAQTLSLSRDAVASATSRNAEAIFFPSRLTS